MTDFNTWKKENPGKSINDFYRDNPIKNISSTPPVPIINQPQIAYQNTLSSSERSINIGNLIFSIALIIGFLMPWLDLGFIIFEARFNGFEFHKVLQLASYLNNETLNSFLLNSIYLIPFGAALSIFGEVAFKRTVKVFGQLLNLTTMIFWSYVIYDSFSIYDSPISVLGYGFYISAACSLYYVYSLIAD